MTSDELRKAIKAQPFIPFRIHMGGSRALTVLHPEYVMIAPSGRTAAIYPHSTDEEPGLEVIDVFMVQSIEYLPKQKRNGRRKAG